MESLPADMLIAMRLLTLAIAVLLVPAQLAICQQPIDRAGFKSALGFELGPAADSKPIREAPKYERQQTLFDTDREFEKGSRLALKQLTNVQITNLMTLGKVWGFLKYYHPEVRRGRYQWDFELFRIMPAVLAAQNPAQANQAMVQWIDHLGPVEDCGDNCAHLEEEDLYFRPDLDWLSNEELLGEALSGRLRAIYKNRPVDKNQFYVSRALSVGNPIFEHEPAYGALKLPYSIPTNGRHSESALFPT